VAFTYASFVNTLATLPVTGIRRAYPCKPDVFNPTDMPFSYPRIPRQQREVIGLGYHAGLKTAAAQLVVVIGPDRLDLEIQNFNRSVALIDAYDTAIGDAAAALGVDRWSIEQTEEVEIDGDVYWALLVTVEASG
jgi:hypothetical protein